MNTVFYKKEWEALSREISARGADGEAVTEALSDYYSIFDDGAVEWLARLYNPTVGGFHYSNSSRDNESVTTEVGSFSLLPDAESSFQALTVLQASGVIRDFAELPKEMREGLKRFICSLQDEESGFIYHPQWKGLMRDGMGASPNADRMWRSRRGRDMSWAIGIAERLGFTLPYKTAYERLGDDESREAMPDYLTDKDKLVAFLDTLDWENDAYYAGNMLAAQARLIGAAGLGRAAVGYLNERQSPETGLWGKKGGYAAINAYLKISCAYNELKEVIPNAEKALPSILECATTEERAATVCYQYNVWFSVKNVLENIRSHGGAAGAKRAAEISRALLPRCTGAIAATKKKLLTFKKPDGSFSYYPFGTADHSQGMPVAIKGSDEGDMNATVICTSGLANNLFAALDISDYFIPLFSPCAFEKFRRALRLTSEL